MMGADFIISTILGISLFMLAGFLLVLYFVPTIVALYLKHPNKLAIILINVFLGWSVMGWVGALVLAVWKREGNSQPAAYSSATDYNGATVTTTAEALPSSEA